MNTLLHTTELPKQMQFCLLRLLHQNDSERKKKLMIFIFVGVQSLTKIVLLKTILVNGQLMHQKT